MTLYYKMRQTLQNATAILLQNATEVYHKMRQVFYYKMRQFYYKMRQLSQIAAILLQNATVIAKCDVYYKMRSINAFRVKPSRLKKVDLLTQVLINDIIQVCILVIMTKT